MAWCCVTMAFLVSLTTLLGIATCLTDLTGDPCDPGDWLGSPIPSVAGGVACGAKLTMRGVTGAVPIRGVAPIKVVGVSEHRAGVVARGVLYPAGVGRSGVESALAVPSNVASSGCVARKAPVEMGSGVAGGKLGSSP
mmetsp:Transcript_26046/g.42229  ORF Transcript_26046/g.42229 Transcript_26046/m.42229 type:complete len:138 (-) Transcript_26046:450-863(-)